MGSKASQLPRTRRGQPFAPRVKLCTRGPAPCSESRVRWDPHIQGLARGSERGGGRLARLISENIKRAGTLFAIGATFAVAADGDHESWPTESRLALANARPNQQLGQLGQLDPAEDDEEVVASVRSICQKSLHQPPSRALGFSHAQHLSEICGLRHQDSPKHQSPLPWRTTLSVPSSSARPWPCL